MRAAVAAKRALAVSTAKPYAAMIASNELSLRRTQAGRLALSFPARRDGSGREHFYIRPIDDDARREIENAVFTALRLEEDTRR